MYSGPSFLTGASILFELFHQSNFQPLGLGFRFINVMLIKLHHLPRCIDQAMWRMTYGTHHYIPRIRIFKIFMSHSTNLSHNQFNWVSSTIARYVVSPGRWMTTWVLMLILRLAHEYEQGSPWLHATNKPWLYQVMTLSPSPPSSLHHPSTFLNSIKFDGLWSGRRRRGFYVAKPHKYVDINICTKGYVQEQGNRNAKNFVIEL